MTAPKEVKQIKKTDCLVIGWRDGSNPEVIINGTDFHLERGAKLYCSFDDHDTEVQALKADLEALVKMYSTKIKRNCQHDDPSWCNQFCNDYGDLARQIGEKWKIKYE